MFSLFVDADGHLNAICDRCSRETRTTMVYRELSMSAITNWIDDLVVHHETHPSDTTKPIEEAGDLGDLGDDEDVEPLAGALADDGEW